MRTTAALASYSSAVS